MNIIMREWKANRKGMLFWSLFMVFFVVTSMIKYDSFADNTSLNELIANMPKGAIEGMGLANIDLSTIGGYLSAMALYLYLILTIHAVLTGSGIIAKEERDKTAEFLFTMPIKRQKVILMKIIAAVCMILGLNLVTFATTFLISRQDLKEAGLYRFILLFFIAIFLLQLMFLSIGMLIAAAIKRHKQSGNIAVTVLMVSFIVAFLINIVDTPAFLIYLTPFQYFDSAYLLQEQCLELKYIFLAMVIFLLGLAGTFFIYPKRDLRI